MGLLERDPRPGGAFVATGRIVHRDTLVAVPGDEVSMATAVALGLIDDEASVVDGAGEVVTAADGEVSTAVTPDLATATAAEVLEAVAGDPARAARALKLEGSGRRRKVLMAELAKIADGSV